jgi:2-polyprenyl-6-methoxyphenol hydroxylase-like FAD-dependent oxidoreductase
MSTAKSSATITPMSSTSSQPPPKVIIIGAGLSGLAIAHGLRRHDIPFVVCEKESTPRDRNWGVTISWAVPFLAKCLPPDLFARLQECQPDIRLNNAAEGKESVLIRDGATGHPLIEPSFPGTRRLQIKRTRRIWGEALLEHGGEGVRYGKVLVGIKTPDEGEHKGKVIAQFEYGSQEVGDVLIGTDGGSSFVRQVVCRDIKGGCEAWDLGYNFVNFPFTLTREQALWLDETINPSVDVGCHPKKMYSGIMILDKPDLEQPETWVFYVLSTWPKEKGVTYGKDDDLLEEYRRRMEGWGDPYRKVADWIPEGTKVRPVLGGLKVFAPKERWNNKDGRVTIGGDAARKFPYRPP